MSDGGIEGLKLPRGRPHPATSRLWREWCFLRVAFRAVRLNLLLLGLLLVTGGVLFRALEPERGHSLSRAVYYTWVLMFGQPPEDFPTSGVLQAMFFVVPLVGLLVILEGLVDFTLLLRDRRRAERSWCRVMAASLSNHVIVVGLGKLGYRTYRLLRELGEAVVVIERSPENQFLDDIRRDGTPLFVGDARREAILEEASVATAKSIIAATNYDLVNLETALDARRMNPSIRVVMRMFDQNMADKVRAGFNIQVAMSQSAISAPAFVTAALEGPIVSSLVVGENLLVVERWTVQRGSALCDATVAALLRDYGLHVIERRPRDGAPQLMPPPDCRLVEGDVALVQGLWAKLRELRGRLAAAG